jgi:anti-sigma regulatory factor (Ser/Thr protein kinase)
MSIDLVDRPESRAVVLPRDTSSVAAARQWLTDLCDDTSIPAKTVGDAVLLVSELVTNALRHGHGDVVCHGCVNGDGDEICVAVADGSARPPVLLPVDPQRVGGFGMLLLERIARQWGVASYPGGKVVWATLRDGD